MELQAVPCQLPQALQDAGMQRISQPNGQASFQCNPPRNAFDSQKNEAKQGKRDIINYFYTPPTNAELKNQENTKAGKSFR